MFHKIYLQKLIQPKEVKTALNNPSQATVKAIKDRAAVTLNLAVSLTKIATLEGYNG